ncbi:mandelate racemase/muconate lactonizing enzyme family protein [Tautonia plasticadhaerens]|uniref:L-Ala-D/L-Glu epimerase n=1 Tax=Tautonia plasticadhaerens TaxID=2527974 RepID=A0A518H4P1_9BACT|nr:mandelate racemase/muconate lactonizing enzyme family protein [Tautonia plasticadhaerens]QDV35804.1 L-Ala-D/L-Glu epimerase [Tautonia plasticadhaerens]
MKISRVDSFLVEVPQKAPIAPYHSRYRGQSVTRSILIRLEADDGTEGWGEAPQVYLGDPLTGREAEALRPTLAGVDPTDVVAACDGLTFEHIYIQSAVEMAMWDLAGKARGVPLYRLLGGPCRSEVELAACMGIQSHDRAGEIARLYVEMGFSTLKAKAGRDPEEDLAMVRGVRDAVGDRLELRIDPNTGYSPEACEQLAKDLEPYRLQYLEQPMGEDLIDESARIRGLTSTPLALNESVTTPERVREILDKEAADVLLPDTYQCGGVWATKRVAEVAASAGVPCVVHCAHDLGPKTAAMLHLAAGTPNFPLANDCTYYGLVEDVLVRPLEIRAGRMAVPQAPGLGIEVDPEKVRKYRVGPPA